MLDIVLDKIDLVIYTIVLVLSIGFIVLDVLSRVGLAAPLGLPTLH